MMTQEEFMEVQVLRSAGWSIRQIAEHVGYHPATISSWLKSGGPPAKRSTPVDELVVDERWQTRIAELLTQNGSSLVSDVGDR
jgi:lambda repressor-like predicted transcriptional regulator